MKTYIKYLSAAFFVTLVFGQTAIAQVSKTEYFMQTSIYRNSINPAFTPEQGYLVVPVIPSVGASVRTNTLNMDHLTFKRGGERVTFIHPDVSTQDLMKGMKNNNFLSTDVNVKLFSLGFFKESGYWNVDMGVRTHVDANLPKSVFELLKVGFDQDQPTMYNLKNINASISSFVEIGVSHSRMFLDDNLSVGAKAKVLLGAGYANLKAEKLDVEAGPDQWRTLSKVTLRGAAPGVTAKYDSDGFIDGFDFDWKGIPGYGLGLDLGVVYDVKDVLPELKGLKVSASLNDLGFISWSKKNTLRMKSAEQEVIITPNDYQHSADGVSLEDVFEDALEDLKNAVNLQEDGAPKSVTTGLRTTLNLGAEYEIFENLFSVGALYSNYFGTYHSISEFTMSANYRPCDWFATSASYSAMFGNWNTLGLAVNLVPKKGLNLFLASDYVFARISPQGLPTTSKGLNVQFGVSISLGGRQ